MPSALLRPWRIPDADALLAAIAATPDLGTQLPLDSLTSRADCARFIDKHLAPVTESGRDLAIELDGVAVGNIGIGSIDRRHGIGWVYYWVAGPARGHGLAAGALRALAQWALTDGDLFRLELGHRVNNPASCAVATGAGFVVEGLERAKLAYGEERFDVERHARLRTDPRPSGAALPIADGTW